MGEPSLDASSPKRPDAPVLSSFVFLDTTRVGSVVQPDRVDGDFGRKSISAVARRVPFHPPSLSDASPI